MVLKARDYPRPLRTLERRAIKDIKSLLAAETPSYSNLQAAGELLESLLWDLDGGTPAVLGRRYGEVLP